jgi:hypothetical protein
MIEQESNRNFAIEPKCLNLLLAQSLVNAIPKASTGRAKSISFVQKFVRTFDKADNPH